MEEEFDLDNMGDHSNQDSTNSNMMSDSIREALSQVNSDMTPSKSDFETPVKNFNNKKVQDRYLIETVLEKDEDDSDEDNHASPFKLFKSVGKMSKSSDIKDPNFITPEKSSQTLAERIENKMK